MGLIKDLQNWQRRRKEAKLIKRLIKKANHKYKTTGKQYFVVPVGSGEYAIINNEALKFYNQRAKKKGISKMTYKKVLEIAVYKTKPGSL